MAQPPSNDDIEAVIQAATSAPHQSYPAVRPPRDTRTQLFVGNLPYRVRWQDLKDLFRRAGTVLRADVSLAPDNRSRGYGTVLLATAEDAGRAIDMFNGFVWQTRTLEVRHDKLGVSASGEEYLSPGGNFGQGVGGIGSPSGSTAGTPFSPVPGLLSRLPSTNVSLRSPYSSTADDLPGINTNLTSHLLAGKLSSPTASSPLLGSGSVPSPLGVHSPLLSQLTGGHNAPSMLSQQNTGVGAGGERSRNLFVGNVRGVIFTSVARTEHFSTAPVPHTVAGPEGSIPSSRNDTTSGRRTRYVPRLVACFTSELRKSLPRARWSFKRLRYRQFRDGDGRGAGCAHVQRVSGTEHPLVYMSRILPHPQASGQGWRVELAYG